MNQPLIFEGCTQFDIMIHLQDGPLLSYNPYKLPYKCVTSGLLPYLEGVYFTPIYNWCLIGNLRKKKAPQPLIFQVVPFF